MFTTEPQMRRENRFEVFPAWISLCLCAFVVKEPIPRSVPIPADYLRCPILVLVGVFHVSLDGIVIPEAVQFGPLQRERVMHATRAFAVGERNCPFA
jgi:hypothetical protein